MKKFAKAITIFTLAIMFVCLLVGCGKTPDESVNGSYYRVDKESGMVEILSVNGGEFTITSFVLNDFENFPEDYSKINETYKTEIENSQTVYRGKCSYTNNFLIKSRLDLEYTEGKSGSTYIYLSEESYADNANRNVFVYSPKMGTILIYALLGFSITLVVLCLLMGIIKLLGFSVDKISAKVQKKTQTENEESEVVEEKLAKGSAGELKLENVSDKDAAMIMAIVADELNEPLNSLRFISIKDITDEEGKK